MSLAFCISLAEGLVAAKIVRSWILGKHDEHLTGALSMQFLFAPVSLVASGTFPFLLTYIRKLPGLAVIDDRKNNIGISEWLLPLADHVRFIKRLHHKLS